MPPLDVGADDAPNTVAAVRGATLPQQFQTGLLHWQMSAVENGVMANALQLCTFDGQEEIEKETTVKKAVCGNCAIIAL